MLIKSVLKCITNNKLVVHDVNNKLVVYNVSSIPPGKVFSINGVLLVKDTNGNIWIMKKKRKLNFIYV